MIPRACRRSPHLTFAPGVRCVTLVTLVLGGSLLPGCGGSPDRVNIELRKQIQSLETEIEQLNRRHVADVATIRSLEQRVGTLPTLPQERLERLVTTHGLHIGRLTAGIDTDARRAGDEALKVYVVPVDSASDPIKAAGDFVVDVFDLSLGEDNLLLRRQIPAEEAAKDWYGSAFSYTYAFTLPWERPPANAELTVRVTFRDLLTGREFADQKVVRIIPPEPAAAGTQPVASP